MAFLETKSIPSDKAVKLFYEDYGTGQPVIFIHGWPLSHQMWEYQTGAIVQAGYRAILYDRRGFGKSDKPWSGYDYNTLAKDLHDLIEILDLDDVILIGFSMGGGEICRYIGNYGTSKIAKAILISSVAPFMLQTDTNPDGVPKETFDNFKVAMRKDRLAFLEDFGKTFFNFEDNKDRVSAAQIRFNGSIAAAASPKATVDCIDSFGTTDFREDVRKFDIPTLIIHGDEDEVVPIAPAGQQAASLIKGSKFEVIDGAPHGLIFTHTDQLNKLLLEFLMK